MRGTVKHKTTYRNISIPTSLTTRATMKEDQMALMVYFIISLNGPALERMITSWVMRPDQTKEKLATVFFENFYIISMTFFNDNGRTTCQK